MLVGNTEQKMMAQHPVISFSDRDFKGIDQNLDDPMVISIMAANYIIKKVLVDQGSSADILYLSTLKRLKIPKDELKPFHRSLVDFSRE